jgi:hypothetical protein
VDFFVSNMSGPGFLYHNNHDGTFTEIAREAGLDTARSFATWFFDYDNDGWPDLFVTSYYPSLDEAARTYLDLPHNATTLKLYRNLGNGTFRDVTKEAGLDKVYMPMGSNSGDIDNDGYLDIYLGTGNPSYGSLVPNVLLRNKEGKSFVDVTASSGTGELHKGHGVAFADLDNDGGEDILAAIGGAVPGDRHVFRLFENPGNGNDWVTLRLIGTKANQTRRQISLSQFAGKVVVAAFVYTSCPLPNYCFRLSNNLGRLQKRFPDRLGHDLILLSATMDPVHDTPEVLAKYGASWNADPRYWHLLTGTQSEVQALCQKFGVDFWPGEGTLTHSPAYDRHWPATRGELRGK